jgi:hypothetical protein
MDCLSFKTLIPGKTGIGPADAMRIFGGEQEAL